MEEVDGTVQRMIFECVDAALSRLAFLNKDAFYRLLEVSYSVKPENIGSNYAVFHSTLKSYIGAEHFQVEKVIMQILKQRVKDGVYSQYDEIIAFNIITAVLMKETDDNIERIKKYMTLEKYVKNLKKIVDEQDNRLKSTERLIAIGETAAMVGHDIRNPLQAIEGDVYLLKEALREKPENEWKHEMQVSLDAIEENVFYINKIVADLQDYARPLIAEREVVNLPDLIAGVFQNFNLPDNITIKIDIKDDLTLKTDPSFIRRALTNLANNAIQAMPDGGELSLVACRKGNKVCIAVSDTGKGIPDEVKEKMFKPLVTTKSKGQGLGLAVVKRLVDALGGKISFESENGKGTKFIIELPAKVK